MDWPHIAEAVSDGLEIALIIRLLGLGLQNVYRLFCIFLLFEVLSSGLAFWIQLARPEGWNYAAVWLTFVPVDCVLYIAMVYVLLNALLAKFPGIRSFSRKVLHFSFLMAAVVAAFTAYPQFSAYEQTHGLHMLDRMLAAGFAVESVISMVALLVLAATLGFVLWFPVQMPRNLALFSIGFVVFFAARTSLLVAYNFGSRVNLDILNIIVLSVFSACLLYWLIFINKAGEEVPARIGHSWNAAEQQRLLAQLEAMNATLLRAARR